MKNRDISFKAIFGFSALTSIPADAETCQQCGLAGEGHHPPVTVAEDGEMFVMMGTLCAVEIREKA